MYPDEVEYLSNAHYKSYKERWEMLRMKNYAVIASQSSKPIKPEDVMKFDWDDDRKNEVIRSKDEDESERERIKKKYNIQTT